MNTNEIWLKQMLLFFLLQTILELEQRYENEQMKMKREN